MPKPNERGGKGYKKNHTNRDRFRPEKKIESVDVVAGEGFYARIVKRLGGKPATFEVTLSNGNSSTVIARGKMHKKAWVNPGMLVLVNKTGEIIKIVKDSDKSAVQANQMMGKIENETSIFNPVFQNDSSDDDSDDDSSTENSQNNISFVNTNRKINKKESSSENESGSNESDSNESDSNESGSNESGSNESDSNESDGNESDSNEIDETDEKSKENVLNEEEIEEEIDEVFGKNKHVKGKDKRVKEKVKHFNEKNKNEFDIDNI